MIKKSNQILIKDHLFDYIITYKNNKNIYFRVKDDLKIYITCNRFVSDNFIRSLLIKDQDSIYKMYQKALENTKDKDDLYYLGNKLIFIESNNKPYISNDYIYAKNIIDAKEYIYSLAYDVFNNRLKQILIRFDNLPSFRLKVRKMTSKWGVCNQKSMTVTLNSDLIFKDVHLIDYVIIHELCHFKHMDHSKLFWEEVRKYYPYYKQARKELNH